MKPGNLCIQGAKSCGIYCIYRKMREETASFFFKEVFILASLNKEAFDIIKV